MENAEDNEAGEKPKDRATRGRDAEAAAQLRDGSHRVPRQRAWIKPVLLLFVIVALFIVLRKVPLKKPLQDFLAWVDAIGFWGPVVLGVVYVIGCVVCLPGSILTLAAGALFGVVGGTITVSIASTLGACAAFVVGRTFARDWIAAKVEGNAKFRAIDKAVGREGFKIVLLTRLSPMFPFNLLNFGYGLTDVRLGHYALASWIGMLPGTIMFVYFGSALGSSVDAFAERGEKTAAETAMFWVGMALAIAVTVFVTRIARRALKDAVQET